MNLSVEQKLKYLKRILSYSTRKGDCLICYYGLGRSGRPNMVIGEKSVVIARMIMHLIVDFDLDSDLMILHNDDICSSKACIEFNHLKIGDRKENWSDTEIKHGRVLGKPKANFCKRGHPRTPENVYSSNNMCKLCVEIHNKRAKDARRSRVK